jgi:hypothetical protein
VIYASLVLAALIVTLSTAVSIARKITK